jgi:CRISPR-associated protein Cas1
MKSVIVDRKGAALEVKRSGIVVDGRHIPFRLIDMLVLAAETSMSSKTLLAIAKERIPVLMMTKNSSHFCLTLPLEAKNGELKMAQYASIVSSRLEFARYYLEEKTRSHARHLGSFGIALELQPWLQKIAQAAEVGELLGIEGSFSRLYFKHYFSLLPTTLHKGKRSKRPPEDPVNALLSYLYTWLYHLITARLYMHGFDAALSYLHEPFRSHNGLSSDILEVFRADVNRQVFEWFTDKTLTLDDFTRKNGVWMRYESRKALWPALKSFNDALMPRIDDEIALLRSAIS